MKNDGQHELCEDAKRHADERIRALRQATPLDAATAHWNEVVRLFGPGTKVETVDNFNGQDAHVNWGNVERVTKTLIIVRNEHGNEQRFRVKDRKQVGYSWPHLTHCLKSTKCR